jgi:hypothetical protein
VFFWVLLGIALLVFVVALGYGVRGMRDREQPPGTQRMR